MSAYISHEHSAVPVYDLWQQWTVVDFWKTPFWLYLLRTIKYNIITTSTTLQNLVESTEGKVWWVELTWRVNSPWSLHSRSFLVALNMTFIDIHWHSAASKISYIFTTVNMIQTLRFLCRRIVGPRWASLSVYQHGAVLKQALTNTVGVSSRPVRAAFLCGPTWGIYNLNTDGWAEDSRHNVPLDTLRTVGQQVSWPPRLIQKNLINWFSTLRWLLRPYMDR